MSGALSMSTAGTNDLKLKLIQAASHMSEVANGAYVNDDMFIESDSQAATALNDVLPVLAQCATDMYTCCESMAKFLQRVIEQFEGWDYQMALKSYMLGTMNTMQDDLESPFPVPKDIDDWAYQQGLNQGLKGQIPNQPK